MVKCPVESYLLARQPEYSLIAVGTVSPIYAINSHSVIKRRPEPSDGFACQAYSIEVRAYERLGDHPRIANIRKITEDGIVIERGECLPQKIQSKEFKTTIRTKLRWAQEAAEGLHYIHTKNIIHADVGCHNLLLDQSGHIKFITFSEKLMRRVEHLFAMGEYPRVDMLVLGGVILRCWNGEYCSMDDVSRDIDACCQGMHDTGDIVDRLPGRCIF